MNLLLRIAEKQLPVFIRKRELKKLFHLTALAFGSEIPSMDGLSYDECLVEYAHFTETAIDQCITRGENIRNIQDRLFQQAYEYGKLWRKRFGISNMDEVTKAGKILYHAIGIEFYGTDRGTIKISKCFFSQFYSLATCKVVASLDAGIMAGLSGGAILSFSQRITEGFSFCKAQLCSKEFIS
jgi:hypothetical protein